MTTDVYDPIFSEPLLSICELRGLLRDLADAGDRAVLQAEHYLGFLLDDGLTPESAWELSGLARKFGPFETADADPIGHLFRGVPGRLFG